jgi:hypothetical protein
MFGKYVIILLDLLWLNYCVRFLTVLSLEGIYNFFVTWKLNGGLSVFSESHNCFPFISISVMKLLEYSVPPSPVPG